MGQIPEMLGPGHGIAPFGVSEVAAAKVVFDIAARGERGRFAGVVSQPNTFCALATTANTFWTSSSSFGFIVMISA